MAGRRVVIIGGGAAGLTAGVLLARAGCAVKILEKTEVCGRKLSMTGNGRCNLSNLFMEASCYNEAAAPLLEKLLGRFGVREVIAFFDSVGVLVRGEEGYLYPVSGQAQTVTDALLHAFLSAGGEILYRRQAKEILAGEAAESAAWVVRTAGERYPADAVLLASGALSGPKTTKSTGDGYYIAEKLGAEIVPATPALCGLQSTEVTLPKETGVRVFARVRCYSGKQSPADGAFAADKGSCAGEPDASGTALYAEETGEVQLTAGRISGIPVMQLSSACARLLAEGKEVTLSLDLFPETTDADFEDMINARIRDSFQQTPGDFLRGFAHAEINRMLAERFDFSLSQPLGEVSAERLLELLRAYRDIRFAIGGTDDFVHAQATAGGIALSSLTETLSLQGAPGVYAIGELVDVNGRCGGYNLQWAWTSALCAAEAVTGLSFPWRKG
ncbi:MAG: NAD(P)/FAD-dependent oxidoreductase [Lachnospiraceae bacterium]|nr:NAD(P)/FAD-dependent oxidoreductase [Lachnospiraceae bacterium]